MLALLEKKNISITFKEQNFIIALLGQHCDEHRKIIAKITNELKTIHLDKKET